MQKEFHYAVEYMGKQIYCDPQAQSHSDVIRTFDLAYDRILSSGYILKGTNAYYKREVRLFGMVYPSDEAEEKS